MANSVAIVRYGSMEETGFFEAAEEGLRKGDDVIVRTSRGVEWGELLSQVQQREVETAGQVLRKASKEDSERRREIEGTLQKEELQFCRGMIKKHKLPMKLVTVQHLFGGSKIIFFFLAEGRVDFRELVKELANKYRTRIELRQIGVRDEARLLGHYGPCGRELCCRNFLRDLKPVPMKSAKSQKSTLDPSKISGCCGRLRCCLMFEDEQYSQLRKQLPRRGTRVVTAKGEAVVMDYEIIQQTVKVKFDDGSQEKLSVGEIRVKGNGKE